jgi:hypothetical protein
MNALTRFLSLGMRDADRRVAAALAPPALEPADRALRDSAIVAAVDRATRLLQTWWTSSQAARLLASVGGDVPWFERYREIGAIVITAVLVHVALTIVQGPRPGWFWMVVPATAAVFALLLLAASREAPRRH